MYWNVGDRVKIYYPSELDWKIRRPRLDGTERPTTWHNQHGTIRSITQAADGNCFTIETDAGNTASCQSGQIAPRIAFMQAAHEPSVPTGICTTPTIHGSQNEGGECVVSATETDVPEIDDVTAAYKTPLTKQDRCDRCGADAYLRAILPGGGDLLFCGHHASTYETALRETAIYLHDERDKINPKPSVAAY